jgi:flavin-dependent dehydrogenase
MQIHQTRYPTYDVAVIGGGMAGIAAAVAAARTGAKTILIEKNGWLGGIGIIGATGLHSFFNIFDAHPSSERLRVVGGIAQELVDHVTQHGGGMGHIRMERGGDFVSMLTPVEPEVFKAAAAEMCLEAGVRLLFHTIVDELDATDGHVKDLIVCSTLIAAEMATLQPMRAHPLSSSSPAIPVPIMLVSPSGW